MSRRHGSGAGFRERRTDLSRVNEQDLALFRQTLGEGAVVTDEGVLQEHNVCWLGKFQGSSGLVLRPKTTEEVSKVLKHCHKRRLAVVPQGGNTGLVGGGVPLFDEVVLSTSRTNQVIEFDEVAGILTCEAGCILENLENWLNERDHKMPLDLGAKGSCQIGGNVATNAGGLRFIRYGSLRGTVLGVEAVLPDGEVVDVLNALRKDNTGFDLKQLFIGSEGVLGVITKVAILTPRLPPATNLAFLSCASYEAVQAVFVGAKKSLCEIVSAVEYMDRESVEITLEMMTDVGLRHPLHACEDPFYMLIETAGSNDEHDQEKMNTFLETMMEEGLVVDGAVAQGAAQRNAFWSMRELPPVAANMAGTFYTF